MPFHDFNFLLTCVQMHVLREAHLAMPGDNNQMASVRRLCGMPCALGGVDFVLDKSAVRTVSLVLAIRAVGGGGALVWQYAKARNTRNMAGVRLHGWGRLKKN